MKVHALTGAALDAALEDLARLRIAVFRDFPYLYDGDMAYERRYLRSYADNPRAVLVVAETGGRIVGAATGMPLADHDDAAAVQGLPGDLSDVFYCAESVLLSPFRGQGIGHRFFDLREDHARALGFARSAFCAVVRSPDHPMRPKDYQPLDAFWTKRGYRPADGVTALFEWTDIGTSAPSSKTLRFWFRDLKSSV